MKTMKLFKYVLTTLLVCFLIPASAQRLEPPKEMVKKCSGVSGYELLSILSEAYMPILDKCEKKLKNKDAPLEVLMETNNIKEECKVYRKELFSLLRKKLEKKELSYTFDVETLVDFEDFTLSPDLDICEVGCTFFNEGFVTLRCNIKVYGEVKKIYGYQIFNDQSLDKKYAVAFKENQGSYYYTLYLGKRKIPKKISINGYE